MKLHRVSIQLEERTNSTLFLAPYVQFQLNDLAYLKVTPVSLEINQGTFSLGITQYSHLRVGVIQTAGWVEFSCQCDATNDALCEHQLLVLTAIARREELSVFFQPQKRQEKIRKVAEEYGLEKEEQLDNHFWISLVERNLVITPRIPGLIRVSDASLYKLQEEIFPTPQESDKPKLFKGQQPFERIIVLRKHKYYQHLKIGIYEASTTKLGAIKNPITELDPHEIAWQTDRSEIIQFCMALSRFQNLKDTGIDTNDLLALKSIVHNQLGYNFYIHQEQISEHINAASLTPIQIGRFTENFILTVVPKADLIEISMKVKWEGQTYALKDFDLKLGCFMTKNNDFRLIDFLPLLSVISYFKKQFDPIRIHSKKFQAFKKNILERIQDMIVIEYADVKTGTFLQLQQRLHHHAPEKIIYLSDAGNYVHIHPVVCYGEIEIPIRTKRLIFDTDAKGKTFQVRRNDEMEIAMTGLLIRQHPDFEIQLENSLSYFYLHKKHFLDENWFPDVFEEWRQQGIQIMGFNELENNKINGYKATVQVQISSGFNWFNADIDVRFGKKKAKLKNLHAAVVNKRKYVQLDDGTLGMLPQEWIERFSQFFDSGEITKEDSLQIPWVNFAAIERHFDSEMLDESAYQRLQFFRQKLFNFEQIETVEVPDTFKGTLRVYQQTGLNWLYFLDQCNFGGCLADDMGLGKTAQMIALMLIQKEKLNHLTHLIVVPTSLLFNWQEEIRKFAPSLSVLPYTGTGRSAYLNQLGDYDVILASYNTVIMDCLHLKKFQFDCIILDESQYIKNPDTQRYKSVSLLKARNRFVMTGTPVENRTFDLYSQLSFACPGLLGSKRSFRDLFAAPIDQFKDQNRLLELQQKIKPFVLRRTKKDVARELPDRSELAVYCEMQPWQRKIYDAYEKEFRDFIDATSEDELRKDPMHVLKGLTQLRQICNSPSLIKDVQVPEDQLSSKLEILIDKISEIMEEHKILIFSQFVSMLDIIGEQLTQQGIAYSKLTGSTRNRQKVISEFKENDDIRVFLISLKAGGTGLNLTEADYVFLVDPWWNPAVEAQAIDRVHRIGQDKKVIAVRLICPDTLEEKIIKMQENKKQLADTLILEKANELAAFSKVELLALLK